MKQKVIPILQETPTIERNVLPKMGFLREPKFCDVSDAIAYQDDICDEIEIRYLKF